MTQVLYAQSAQTDLLEAWLFIAEENMPAADRTIETIEREAETLSLQPKMGRARPELGKDVRSWPTSTPTAPRTRHWAAIILSIRSIQAEFLCS